jgi:uncharacterized alpha-E superfamily protein
MWEQLNALFLAVRQLQSTIDRDARQRALCRTVIEGIHLFQGIMDETMGHGEGWQYLQAGRFIERAGSTAGLIDGFLIDGGAEEDGRSKSTDWVALLRSCCALEAYCRHYTADVRPERVTEFLLLNADFPRSVRFAAARLESAVHALDGASGRGAGGRTDRLVGRLHASLDYGQVDEILSDNPHAYLSGIGRQCAQIHTALYQTYIAYRDRVGDSCLTTTNAIHHQAHHAVQLRDTGFGRASWKRACSHAPTSGSAACISRSARRRRRASWCTRITTGTSSTISTFRRGMHASH